MRSSQKTAADELMRLYRELAGRIHARQNDFKEAYASYPDEKLFGELSFCTLTPQSKAHQAWKVIEELMRTGLLMNGSAREIAAVIRAVHGVRFHNNKSRYIVENRTRLFTDGKFLLREMIDVSDLAATRRRLVKNIRGIGIKEASHFLRNIGFGDTVAIIDRHVLKNLIPLGILRRLPRTLTERTYIDIEAKMAVFSSKIGISLADLDLVLWYKEAGDVFK